MNNESSLKTNNSESSKTPGGISKSLLTPCRRVGLSRNWKRKGPSPFISPLPGTEEVKQENTETRKRKQRVFEEELKRSPTTTEVSQDIGTNDVLCNKVDIEKTPTRKVGIPHKKKSKTLLSALSKCQENTPSSSKEKNTKDKLINESQMLTKPVQEVDLVCTPLCLKSNNRTMKCLSSKSFSKEQISCSKPETEIDIKEKLIGNTENNKLQSRTKSPKELTKECMVVIRKKLFKQKSSDLEKLTTQNCIIINENEQKAEKSQVLFDSDSDDVPLGKLSKNENIVVSDPVINLDEDDDFTDTTKPIVKVLGDKKIQSKALEKKNGNKKIIEIKHKIDKSYKPKLEIETCNPLQTSFDDEDFEFDSKKTILIRKSYEKVTKPLKAKSTGSITQKDIDNLKARIEAKKQLLIAKSMTEDTKDLRELVKKWQTGCQNALLELMELMRSKFPDKQNMDYSEILQTLKIPSSLVGYDSENDCFITPDDTSIILSGFNL